MTFCQTEQGPGSEDCHLTQWLAPSRLRQTNHYYTACTGPVFTLDGDDTHLLRGPVLEISIKV